MQVHHYKHLLAPQWKPHKT